jgi:hypothetical protein
MSRRLSRSIVTLALLAFALIAADAKKAPPPEPTAEQRQKIAEVYQKMADCARSTRPMVPLRDHDRVSQHWR